MSLETIITKGRGFDSAIAETVVNKAMELAQDIWDTYGDDIARDKTLAGEVADGITEGVKSPRNSEWKAFATSIPYGMVEALREYPKTGKGLTRVHLFKLARRLIEVGDYRIAKETARKFVKGLDKAKTGKGGYKATIGMGLGIIKNTQTRKRNEIAFRKELAELCAKYNINF